MFGAIAGGIASALAGGAMSKLFGGGQKAASGGIQGDVLATDNNTAGMGEAGITSGIQDSNVPNPDEAAPSFSSGAMANASKGLLEDTLQAGTSAVSAKVLDLVGVAGLEPLRVPEGWRLVRLSVAGNQILERDVAGLGEPPSLESASSALARHQRELEDLGFEVSGRVQVTGGADVGAASLAAIGSGLVKGWDHYYRNRAPS